MTRVFSYCLWFALAILILVGFAETAAAQAWPYYPDYTEEINPNTITRGPGGYFHVVKFGALIAVYLLWVKTTDWANRDCQTLKLPHSLWNPVIFFSFVIGLLLALLIPVYAAGMTICSLTYLVPILAYVFKRNSVVQPHERVLTPSHMRFLFSKFAKSLGFSVAEEKKSAHEKGAPVVFTAEGGSNHQNQANEITSRQSPGFFNAKTLIADVVDQRAEKVMMDFGQEDVAIRYQIDGVWHESESQDRETGDATLAVYKTLANLKVEERRKRQAGRFKAEYNGTNYNSMLVSQGTQTGERIILQVDRPTDSFDNLEQLGMRKKMVEDLTEILSQEAGFVLFSATPSNGLSTATSMGLKLTDRYMRDFVALQNVKAPEPLAENVDLVTWDESKGESPEKLLVTIIRKEPAGVVMNELPNAECVRLLCEQAVKDKMIVATIRAKEAVEALLRVLLLKVPATSLAPAISGVVNVRLIRKLCENCKEAYEPTPQLLQKLGIPAGRIEMLYRPPDPAEVDKPCTACNGIGYFGRTAIFELLKVNDHIRKALSEKPKLELLRQIAKKTGNRTLQQEGIVLVAQGVTSLAELSRVMKQ